MRFFGYYAKFGRGGNQELQVVIDAASRSDAQKKLLKRAGYDDEVAQESGGWDKFWELMEGMGEEEIFEIVDINEVEIGPDGIGVIRDEDF